MSSSMTVPWNFTPPPPAAAAGRRAPAFEALLVFRSKPRAWKATLQIVAVSIDQGGRRGGRRGRGGLGLRKQGTRRMLVREKKR